MMKQLITLLAISGMLASNGLHADENPFTTVVDFRSLPVEVETHKAEERQQSAKIIQIDNQPQFRVEWKQSIGPFMEFCLPSHYANTHAKLPLFTTARIKLRVFLPEKHSVHHLNLRLRDSENEIFQYACNVSNLPAGWHTLEYNVNSNGEKAGCWGGGRNPNKRMDFPVRFHGLGIDYILDKANGMTNWFTLESVQIGDIVELMPRYAVIDTGHPIHILAPEQENNLRIILDNDSPRIIRGTLEYTISDYKQTVINQASLPLDVSPKTTFSAPVKTPAQFGVYHVKTIVKDNDKRIPQAEKTTSFAYMKPVGATSGRAEGFLFGVCSHPQRNSAETIKMEALAASEIGIKILREDISWDLMQPSKDRWNFEPFDRVVNLFGEQGVEIQAIYDYCPHWATAKDWKPLDSTKRGVPRPDYDLWRTFIAEFSKRYKDTIRYGEVWNEPDLIGFANYSVEEYIQLMKIAYEEVKKYAPNTYVLTGGFALMPPSSHASLLDPDHMKKTLTLGRGSYDVHAFHGHGRLAGYRMQLDNMFKLRKEENITAPWYANETALPSTDGGEHFQAVTLFQKFLYSWAKGAIGYNWYDLRNDGYDATYGEHNFGLVTRDFYPKCAYATYNMLATLYTKAAYIADMDFGPQIDAFAFRAQNGDLLIPSWNLNRAQENTMVILVGITGKASVIDLYGNETPLETENNALVYKIERNPATLRIQGQEKLPVNGGHFFTVAAHEPIMKGNGNCKEYLERQKDFFILPGQDNTLSFIFRNPTAHDITADIELAMPTSLRCSQPKQSVTIPPNSQRDMTFKLMASKDFGSNGISVPIIANSTFGNLWKGRLTVTANPVIMLPADGNQPQFTLNDRMQYVKLVAEAPELQHLTWSGPDDLSANVWLELTKDDFILKAVVIDDIHAQPFTDDKLWQGDSIQFALCLGDTPYYEFGIARNQDGSSNTATYIAPPNRHPKLHLTTIRDEATHTTTYVCSIPRDDLGLTPQRAQDGFLFNLIVNDNDGDTREGYLELAPGIGREKNARYFQLIKERK